MSLTVENKNDDYSGSDSESVDLKAIIPMRDDLIIFNFPLFFGAGVVKFSFPQQHDFKITSLFLMFFFIFLMTMGVYTFFPLIATTFLTISIVSTLTKIHNFYYYWSKGLCNCKMIWMAALICVFTEIVIFSIFVGIAGVFQYLLL
jgi:hypothetical protein